MRHWAKESDCADCGQSEAKYTFQATTDPETGVSICEGCSDQYDEGDLEERKQ